MDLGIPSARRMYVGQPKAAGLRGIYNHKSWQYQQDRRCPDPWAHTPNRTRLDGAAVAVAGRGVYAVFVVVQYPMWLAMPGVGLLA